MSDGQSLFPVINPLTLDGEQYIIRLIRRNGSWEFAESEGHRFRQFKPKDIFVFEF
jgi:hypothetical protein